MQHTPKIALLGLGAMGQRMAHRLLEAGHDVTLWNRSGIPAPLRTRWNAALQIADSPAAAVQGKDVVLVMVTGDEASRALVETGAGATGVLDALTTGALLVEHSTLTAAWVSELAGLAKARGVRFVEAPVVGSRPQAEQGQLVALAGGEGRDVDALRPLLANVARSVHHMGPSPAGAQAKLIANSLFGTQVAALAELLGLASRAGLPPETLMRALSDLPLLSPAAQAAAGAMMANQFAPMFPVELVAKDFGYAQELAETTRASIPVVRASAQVFRSAQAQGLASENLTAVAKLYR